MSVGFVARIVFLCEILFLMWAGSSAFVCFIFPLGMLCLSALRIILVNMLLAVCVFEGGGML